MITQSWATFIVESIHAGFLILTIICLLLRLFKGRAVSRYAVNMQYSANLVLAFGVILDILMWAELYYDIYFGGNDYEQFAFFTDSARFQYEPIFLACTILYWVIGLSFFIPRLRVSWLLSLLVLILMNAGFLISLFISPDHDYLPAGWSIHEMERMVIAGKILAFVVLTSLVYLILSKRKKLPYS